MAALPPLSTALLTIPRWRAAKHIEIVAAPPAVIGRRSSVPQPNGLANPRPRQASLRARRSWAGGSFHRWLSSWAPCWASGWSKWSRQLAAW